MSHFIALLLASTGAAAPPDAGGADAGAAALVRIVGTNYFDVGACWAVPPVLSSASKEGLAATLVDVQPQIKECLAPPSRRGAADLTHVAVETTLTEGGPRSKISGDNLTPEGIQCVQAAVDGWLKKVSAFSAKGASGSAQVTVKHNRGLDPAVQLGINPQSDAIAHIRLAEADWCACFAPWKGVSPRQLQGKVSIAQTRTAAPSPPTAVTFAPGGDAAADQVTACVKGKIASLKFPTSSSSSFELPFTLKYVESGFSGDLAEDTPDLQFVQLDLQRSHANAEAAVALAARDSISSGYAELVKQYRSESGKRQKTVKIQDLVESCQWLLQADDGVTGAFTRVLELEKRAHAFASTQKTKDPAWAEAEAASVSQEASAAAFVERAQKNRAGDQGACPKVH